ncbi:hypothetical protein [Clostridium sp. OF09-36]|uniref:hypothetical protein n=1 Tax=Clostridium sp. OF09-36 TaxID=2292310 RepID=UPI0011C22EA1|nr:hypothetical protein [Clostridium sp. OF09-36]
MMKKIRMTACVLIFAMTVCLLAGCSNQNGNNMADEATTASQGAPNGQNGNGRGTAAGKNDTNNMESGMAGENGGAGNGTSGTGGTTGNGGINGNGTGGQESTGVVDGLVDDVERVVQ